MSKRILIPLAVISILSVGCAVQPENGEIIFAEVTHIFNEEEFRNAVEEKGSFKGFFYERKLSMLEAAMREGITLDEVKNKRLVASECSCGAACYASYPLLLPEGVTIPLYDLVELEAGTRQWQGETRRDQYTLGKYKRHVPIQFKDWTRIEGNHNLLPVCYPAKWAK